MNTKHKESYYTEILSNNLNQFIHRAFYTINPGKTFIDNWHIAVIAEYLTALEKGDIRRLIINMPPRSLKSLCINVAWPAWLLGQNPESRIISTSYSQHLSTKHSIDCRHILAANWYRNLFPETALSGDQNQKNKFMTTRRGFRFATSVGGTLTGEGGDILIIDDPENPLKISGKAYREAVNGWFDSVLSTRLDDKKKGAFVLVMQRLHKDDLTGYLLEKDPAGWEHLTIPAIQEQAKTYGIEKRYFRDAGSLLISEREGFEHIEQAKRDLGSQAFLAQYQQQPAARETVLVKPEWIARLRDISNEPKLVIQSWDTAIKEQKHNDYSVCATWFVLEEGYFLADIFKEKMDYPNLRKKIIAHAEHYKPHHILIEDKASGQSLLQELKRIPHIPIHGIEPKGNKLLRFMRVSALFEAGKIFLPHYAPWLADFEQELFEFPDGKHDDQVDACTQFLNWIVARPIIRPTIRSL